MFVPSDEGERGISYRGVSPLLMGYNTYTLAPHEFAERAPATGLARRLEPRARSRPARERRVQNGSASGSGACTGPARTLACRKLDHPRQKINLPALIKLPTPC